MRKVLGDAALRKLVVGAISLLLIHQAGVLLWALFGALGGIASAVVVAGVSLGCARLARAGVGNTVWLLVPTLLFTVVPLVVKVWHLLADEQDWLDKAMGLIPFLVGFLVPVVLLALVYAELRSRDSRPPADARESPAPSD
ncbi:MAG: hypothetical protein ACE5E5_05870 [Phycisphaerae bacterium]